MSTTEPFLIGRWIYGTLSGDTQLSGSVNSIARGRSPLGTPFPHISYHLVSGQDMLAGYGAVKTHVHAIYQVDVWNGGTAMSAACELAARRIYDLLKIVPARGDLSVQTADGIVYDCIHQITLERYGVDQGVEWNGLHQQFEINASAA